MKKSIFILISFILSTPLFAKLNIIVSIQPQMEFVKKIGGEHIQTTLMVSSGKSPHNYEPKAQQMIAISKAELYLAIGVEFEKSWIPKFTAQNRNLKVIDISKDINKTAMIDNHEHHQDKKHLALDPHIWVNPINVKTIAKNIFKALSSVDKKHRDDYKKNLDTYLQEIDNLDKEIKEMLKDTPKDTTFMVFHPSWGYFAKQYRLKQLAIEIEGKTPKPKEIIDILKEAKEKKIKAIFTQPEFSDKSANIIAKELKIEVLKTSPLAKDWSENLKNLAKAIAKNR